MIKVFEVLNRLEVYDLVFEFQLIAELRGERAIYTPTVAPLEKTQMFANDPEYSTLKSIGERCARRFYMAPVRCGRFAMCLDASKAPESVGSTQKPRKQPNASLKYQMFSNILFGVWLWFGYSDTGLFDWLRLLSADLLESTFSNRLFETTF